MTEGGDDKLNVELETLNTSFFIALKEDFALLLLAVLRESLVFPKGILTYQFVGSNNAGGNIREQLCNKFRINECFPKLLRLQLKNAFGWGVGLNVLWI